MNTDRQSIDVIHDELSEEEKQIKLVHSPVNPDSIFRDSRITSKITIYEGNKRVELNAKVWRLSPLGIEISIGDNEGESRNLFSQGDTVDLSLWLGKEKCEFKGVVIKSVFNSKNNNIIGIRWYDAGEKRKHGEGYIENRRSPRWLCGTEFLPTGMVTNPYKFNDFIHFQVRDISAGGMQLLTSLRNKYLVPGMKLEGIISFPMVAQLRIDFEINNVRISTINGKEFLSVGVKILSLNNRLREVIGQYIFQFGPGASIEELKKHGFIVSNASHGIEFSYVRTKDDYEKVLELRAMAYSKAGKIPEGAKPENMADIYDTRARIIMAKYRGELIATSRIIFHEQEDELEHERFLKLPDDFPGNHELVEITRFCTHPDYRGSNIFYALMAHTFLTVIQSGRRYMVSSAAGSMINVYKKTGFDISDIEFKHGDLGDLTHRFFIGDIHRIITGRGINPFIWNRVFSGFCDYLTSQEIFEVSPLVNLRFAIYRMLKPLIIFLNLKPRRKRKGQCYR